jgi:hypothetical protein
MNHLPLYLKEHLKFPVERLGTAYNTQATKAQKHKDSLTITLRNLVTWCLSGKTFQFALLLLVFIYACNNPQQKSGAIPGSKDSVKKKPFIRNTLGNVKYVKSVADTLALLKMFFAPDTIFNKTALWKPDPEAQINMKVPDDGYCRTVIDTIMYPEKDKSVCIVVFLTGENYIGWAELEKGKDGYEVEAFKKNVFWDDCPHLSDCMSVEKYGDDDYAIHGGLGLIGGSYEAYYDTRTGDNIFGYCSSFERMGTSSEQNARFIKGKEDMKDIRINGTSISITEKPHRKTIKKINRHFKWNYERMQYVEVLKGEKE